LYHSDENNKIIASFKKVKQINSGNLKSEKINGGGLVAWYT